MAMLFSLAIYCLTQNVFLPFLIFTLTGSRQHLNRPAFPVGWPIAHAHVENEQVRVKRGKGIGDSGSHHLLIKSSSVVMISRKQSLVPGNIELKLHTHCLANILCLHDYNVRNNFSRVQKIKMIINVVKSELIPLLHGQL